MKRSSQRLGVSRNTLLLLTFLALLLPSASVAQQGQERTTKPESDKLQGKIPVDAMRPRPDTTDNQPYKIRRGDELDIKVLGEEKLSHAYVVGPDGRISFEYVGSLDAAGFTREQIAEKVKVKLTEIYYNPLVSVAITKYSTLKAYVLGQVMKPGLIEFTNDTTLLRALSLAGGVARENVPGQYGATVFSPPDSAYIIRNPDTIINISLHDLLQEGNRSLDVPILEDDFIFVPLGKHKRVFVLGEVTKPSVIDLKDDDLDVVGAIAQAGGFTPNASLSNVQLIRKTNLSDPQPKATNINFKMLTKNGDMTQDPKLLDQDIILVPKSKMSFVRLAIQNGALGFVYLGLQLTGH